jgi:hypothetical protein
MKCAREGCSREALDFSIYCPLHRPAVDRVRRRATPKKKAASKRAAKKAGKKA